MFIYISCYYIPPFLILMPAFIYFLPLSVGTAWCLICQSYIAVHHWHQTIIINSFLILSTIIFTLFLPPYLSSFFTLLSFFYLSHNLFFSFGLAKEILLFLFTLLVNCSFFVRKCSFTNTFQ